jgi:hypothetical protein
LQGLDQTRGPSPFVDLTYIKVSSNGDLQIFVTQKFAQGIDQSHFATLLQSLTETKDVQQLVVHTDQDFPVVDCCIGLPMKNDQEAALNSGRSRTLKSSMR